MRSEYELKQQKTAIHFNLKAGNGPGNSFQRDVRSTYAAENGIESVRKNSPDDDRYDRKPRERQVPFHLRAAGKGRYRIVAICMNRLSAR